MFFHCEAAAPHRIHHGARAENVGRSREEFCDCPAGQSSGQAIDFQDPTWHILCRGRSLESQCVSEAGGEPRLDGGAYGGGIHEAPRGPQPGAGKAPLRRLRTPRKGGFRFLFASKLDSATASAGCQALSYDSEMKVRIILFLLLACCLCQAQSRPIDPALSKITIHVDKTGVFSFAGDKHEITAPIASGSVDEKAGTVEFTIESSKLKVLDPQLDEKKRAEVQKTMHSPAVLDSVKYSEIK